MSRYCKHGVISDMCCNAECCPMAAAKEKVIEARRSAADCSPSSDTPETDAVEFEVIDDYECGINVVSSCLARKLERQRDELAEALREMRYGHTDKAESMAIAALAYLENAKSDGSP